MCRGESTFSSLPLVLYCIWSQREKNKADLAVLEIQGHQIIAASLAALFSRYCWTVREKYLAIFINKIKTLLPHIICTNITPTYRPFVLVLTRMREHSFIPGALNFRQGIYGTPSTIHGVAFPLGLEIWLLDNFFSNLQNQMFQLECVPLEKIPYWLMNKLLLVDE